MSDGLSQTVVDARIRDYIDTIDRLQRGEFVLPASVGSGDDVARLGASLAALSATLEQQYHEVAHLSGLTASINKGLLLEEVLDGVYRDFHDIIPYDRLGCALLEQNGQVLRARWARTGQTRVLVGRGYSAPMAGSSLEDILRTGAPRVINDLPAYLALKPQSSVTRDLVEEGYRSSLTCPLIASGVPCGFLFFTSVSPGTYAEAHVGIFQHIAGQLSVIVEKARLMSDLMSQKQLIEEQNQQLQRINEDKNRFLGIAAHDLRNPIGAIRGVADLLLSPDDHVSPEEQRAFLQDVADQAGFMLGLLDDLLDVSHIESGRLVLHPSVIESNRFLAEVVRRHSPVAVAKGSRLLLAVGPALTITADPSRLRQVMDNLLSNAIKYSPRNATVRLASACTAEGWRVSILDEGPGLTAGDHEHLFHDFAKLSARPTGGEGSTGLGLAITRRIIEAHGGQIGALPGTERGTEFWFTIPGGCLGEASQSVSGNEIGGERTGH